MPEKKPDNTWSGIIGPHGGYLDLKSYRASEIVYDATVVFCDRYVGRRSRTHDQMVQAARSGRQNIAEGSVASGTSRKTELKLVGVARASLEELLIDYQDFIRQRSLALWPMADPRAQAIRRLAYAPDRSYKTYAHLLSAPETAANAMVCLIHQTNYLLDRQLRELDRRFRRDGGFTEKLHRVRTEGRARMPAR